MGHRLRVTTLALKKWQEIPWESKLEGSHVLAMNAEHVLANPKTRRMLRSEAGHLAFLSTRGILDACPDLTIQFDKRVGDDEVIGVVVSSDTPLTGANEELCELAKICDLIAVPDAMAQLPQEFTPCGKMSQRSNNSVKATWIVLASKASEIDLLMRDAPADIGEPPDNLDARARWFQKRHASDS